MKPVAFFLVFTLFLFACDRQLNTPNSPTAPDGAYSYTAYTAEGEAVVNGWFSIEFSDSSTISGEWHFKALGDSQSVGPHIGDGEFIGSMTNDTLFINLNPGWVDNNVLLNGTLSENRIDGTWMWVTFAGPWSGGSFKAIKK